MELTSTWWQAALHHPRSLIDVATVIAVWVVAMVVRLWQKRREQIAQGWPSVEGCIQFANVSPIKDSSQYSVTLQYSYFVDEYRSGEHFRIFANESDADDFARALKDKKIQVRYNPSNPDKSLVESTVIEQQLQLSPRIR